MSTEYGNRIKKAMAHANLDQKGLVSKTGLAQSTISSAINRGNGSSYTVRIAIACEVNPLWLEAEIGDMLDKFSEPSELKFLSTMLESTPKELHRDSIHAATVAMLPYVNKETAPAKAPPVAPVQVASKSGKPRTFAKVGKAQES